MSEVVVIASSTPDAASALARRLAARGARVAVLTAERKPLPDMAREMVQAGSPAALTIPCDLTNPEAVGEAAIEIERTLGPIDRWINTAMTDLKFVYATHAALHAMRGRDRGAVVQVGAPHTIRIFTESLRNELRLAGSHVSLESVRGYPFRRVGAAVIAGAAALGLVLLRRLVR